MNPNTQKSNNSNFEPEAVARALDKVLDAQLKKSPIQITDAGTRYEVTGIEQGFFKVNALDASGLIASGGITELPCDEHYLQLVLNEWTGAGEAGALSERTMAAGAAG